MRQEVTIFEQLLSFMKILLAFIIKMSLCRGVRCLFLHFSSNLNKFHVKQQSALTNRIPPYLGLVSPGEANHFHTSFINYDLMEFFDDPSNWGTREVKVGRAWRVEELRIKSNSDLHKLWYVLLKEKNMLLTMEHEYNQKYEAFPNPERIDKVNESMENLETVVRERNRAYFELETGENGERPKGEDTNCFGLTYTYKMGEHVIPKEMNTKYKEYKNLTSKTDDHAYVSDFLKRLQEKKRNRDYYQKLLRYKVVCKLLEKFPHLDEEALKEQFPDIDIEMAKKDKRSRGHRENAY